MEPGLGSNIFTQIQILVIGCIQIQMQVQIFSSNVIQIQILSIQIQIFIQIFFNQIQILYSSTFYHLNNTVVHKDINVIQMHLI